MPERSSSSRLGDLVASYRYTDESGALLYEVCRYSPKAFRQRRPDGLGGWHWSLNGTRRVLYRLHEIKAPSITICEGEKDVDALRAISLPSTTNSGGAGKWLPAYTDQLTAAKIERAVLLPDHDEPGRQHMQTVATSLHAAGIAVRIVELPGLP